MRIYIIEEWTNAKDGWQVRAYAKDGYAADRYIKAAGYTPDSECGDFYARLPYPERRHFARVLQVNTID